MSSTYSIKWHEDALDDLRRLDKPTARRIVNKVSTTLIQSPRDLGKPLQGPLKGLFRYRIGDYRVVYLVQDDKLVILVVRVGHRR